MPPNLRKDPALNVISSVTLIIHDINLEFENGKVKQISNYAKLASGHENVNFKNRIIVFNTGGHHKKKRHTEKTKQFRSIYLVTKVTELVN